ncbi:PPE domain-containing protein [Lentzea kentuckyensis]|uniref:PPE domain-containing protein n=1 Tax=Lentzea kentuckyensis TaxID=360086 RepID=UPI000A35DA67|nr:PPE domain-containing protein [Lentzea kentuckyensis]
MPPETDPREIENKPVLTDPQNWASRSHSELYAAVHNNNDPGQAGQISSDWGKYGSELTEASRTINAVITSSETKWTGAAAEAARAAMKRLGDWVDETARTAVEVGNKVADQGRVMEAARAQMPAPVQFDWNKAAAALSQPGTPAFVLAAADIAVANAASRAAHDQAINVMTTMEHNSRQIDSSVPTFKPPFNPNTGEVEQPVLATARSGAAPALGTGVDSLMSTHAQGAAVAAPPSPTGAGAGGGGGAGGAANQPAAAAYSPSAPGYTGPGSTGSGGGAAGYTPQMPGYNPNSTNTNVAAAYTPTAPGYSGPANTGSTYTSSSSGGGGGSTYTPQMTGYNPSTGGGNRPGGNQNTPDLPRVPVVGKDLANPNYTPQNLKGPAAYTPTAPGYNGPGGPGGGAGGGGGGGGGAGMKGGPMPYSPSMGGGGGGGFGGGAGGAGGAMQPGGSAGVQGQGARPGMMGMGPGGASAAGAGMGAGAPMGGAPAAGGKGEDDKEHRSASYIMGGDLFEVPGENLPPSVIGAGKAKKKGPDAS